MREVSMNRREFVIASGASLLGSTFSRMDGQSTASDAPDRSYSEETPNMLVSYFTGHLNQLASSWDQKRALLQTAADVQERNRIVRESVLFMPGKFPQKTPLDAVTVKGVEKDGYRVENIMFQSRSDFWVTGNLYVPTAARVMRTPRIC
jgi:hypothetical protein